MFNHALWHNWPAKQPKSVKKHNIRAITPFKVIQGHRDRYQLKPICDFLLVINSNWRPILYRFGVIAGYCSNFGHLAFFSHPLEGLRDNIRCSSCAHWKTHRPSWFPASVNWIFSLGVGAEALLAEIDRKSAIAPMRSVSPKISGRMDIFYIGYISSICTHMVLTVSSAVLLLSL